MGLETLDRTQQGLRVVLCARHAKTNICLGVSIMIEWNVTALKALPGHRLEVAFADGLKGIVDMSKDDFSGVFAPLANESYFALAAIRNGVVVWPNGVDIAPDAMYDEVSGRKSGRRIIRVGPLQEPRP
jgi:hypothetical protein